MTPTLLVFDLDGTLIDSSLDLCNAVNAAVAHVGRQPLPHALISSYIGDGAAMLVRRALGDPDDLDSLEPASSSDLFERTYRFFVDFYRQHKLDNTQCYPGVLDALTEMRERHPQLHMAVLTNKPVNPAREICVGLGLAPFFFQVYGGNSFATKKPEPEGLLALMREADARPEETVLIGDSAVDVLTAQRAGAASLGCRFGLAPESLQHAVPDFIVDHAAEWPAALGL